MVEEADQVAQVDQVILFAIRQRLSAEDWRSYLTLPGGGAYGSQSSAIEAESGARPEAPGSKVGDVERLQRMPRGDLAADLRAVLGAGCGVQRVKQFPDGNRRGNLSSRTGI